MKHLNMVENVVTTTTLLLKHHEEDSNYDAITITVNLNVEQTYELFRTLDSLSKLKGKVYAIRWLKNEFVEVIGLKNQKILVEHAIDYYNA